MSEEQQIYDAERVQRFLADEAVQHAFGALEQRYIGQWKASASPAEREAAWAKSRALDDLQTELQAVIDTGTRAAAEKKRRDRAR